MGALTSLEQKCVEAASAEPMLAQVENWSAVNSGSRNLDGLGIIGARLAGAFTDLPGELAMLEPTPVEAVDATGKTFEVPHGRNLHLKVRADAPVQLLFTGHMDTVFGVDHEFQATPGPFSTLPGSSQLSDWNSWSMPNTVSMWPVKRSCTGASGRTLRCRLRP